MKLALNIAQGASNGSGPLAFPHQKLIGVPDFFVLRYKFTKMEIFKGIRKQG